MRPRRTHHSNQCLTLHGENEDHSLWGEALPIDPNLEAKDPCSNETCFKTVWEPTEIERQRILAGENIELTCYGMQPPVALDLTSVPLGRKPSEARS